MLRTWRIVGALFAVGLTACTDDDAAGGATSRPQTSIATETTEPPRQADGTLSIGVLAPQAGEGAAIGQSLTEAVTATVDRINALGGVNGVPVELDLYTEGESPTAPAEAVAELDDDGVDAVVGPASSLVALETLDDLLSAGILTCSPTATALALDGYPDADLFFRTAPSDSLQAQGIATLAARTGATTAAIAYLDDAYGRPLAEATASALRRSELTVEQEVPYSATDEDLSEQARQVVDAMAEVIVVIGDADHGLRMLSALGSAIVQGAVDPVPEIIVNGAMRTSSPQLVQMLAPSVREHVQGLSVSAISEGGPQGLFATMAVDCVNLIALAAVVAESDDPRQMAAYVSELSRSGQPCTDFESCVAFLDRNVDYQPQLDIGPAGDPTSAQFEVFAFDETGADVPVRPLQVSAS